MIWTTVSENLFSYGTMQHSHMYTIGIYLVNIYKNVSLDKWIKDQEATYNYYEQIIITLGWHLSSDP